MLDILAGHFTAEWQQASIAGAFILLLTIGLTEAAKRMQLFDFLDESLPHKLWKRNVMRFAFWLGLALTLLIMPAIADGTPYMRAMKVLVLAVANGVLALLGFETIKMLVRLFRGMVIEKLRAVIRHQVVEKPSQRGDDIDEDSTLVRFARGKGAKR
jgi:hypothetical protein